MIYSKRMHSLIGNMSAGNMRRAPLLTPFGRQKMSKTTRNDHELGGQSRGSPSDIFIHTPNASHRSGTAKISLEQKHISAFRHRLLNLL